MVCTFAILATLMVGNLTMNFFEPTSGYCGPGWAYPDRGVAYVNYDFTPPILRGIYLHELCHLQRPNPGENALARAYEEFYCSTTILGDWIA
jgi:hypothetical protein